jgi:hypothetical protein
MVGILLAEKALLKSPYVKRYASKRSILKVTFAAFLSLMVFNTFSHSAEMIPSSYQGIWDASQEACTERFSDMRLAINSTTVEYWESSGELIEIIESKHISLVAKFKMMGEGEVWESIITYFIDINKQTLVQVFDNGIRVTRVRCIDA